jgi:hypothetical protein
MECSCADVEGIVAKLPRRSNMYDGCSAYSIESREMQMIVSEISDASLRRLPEPHAPPPSPLLYLQFNAAALASPNLRQQVVGLERLLSDAYRAPVSLFQFLNWMTLDAGVVVNLLSTNLEALVTLLCQMTLEIAASSPRGNERLMRVIADYYGLNGQAPMTLQQIGLQLSCHFTRAHHARKRALRLFADTFAQAAWWQVASQRVTTLL